MKENFASINVIIDRSGSMDKLTKDTIGGFNTFLMEQKAAPGEAIFTLAMFSDYYSLMHDCASLSEVQPLNETTYKASGGTALLDAIGRTINATGLKLAAMKEEDRPSKVIFLIMTDGDENSSEQFAHAKIMEMINHQRDKYSWEFVFIGANQDAIKTGNSLGVQSTHSYNYVASAGGTKSAYASMSKGVSGYRRAKIGEAFTMDNPLTIPTSPVPPATDNETK